MRVRKCFIETLLHHRTDSLGTSSFEGILDDPSFFSQFSDGNREQWKRAFPRGGTEPCPIPRFCNVRFFFGLQIRMGKLGKGTSVEVLNAKLFNANTKLVHPGVQWSNRVRRLNCAISRLACYQGFEAVVVVGLGADCGRTETKKKTTKYEGIENQTALMGLLFIYIILTCATGIDAWEWEKGKSDECQESQCH